MIPSHQMLLRYTSYEVCLPDNRDLKSDYLIEMDRDEQAICDREHAETAHVARRCIGIPSAIGAICGAAIAYLDDKDALYSTVCVSGGLCYGGFIGAMYYSITPEAQRVKEARLQRLREKVRLLEDRMHYVSEEESVQIINCISVFERIINKDGFTG